MFLKRWKRTPDDPAHAGRRHVTDAESRKTQVFSYYANRSTRSDTYRHFIEHQEKDPAPPMRRNTTPWTAKRATTLIGICVVMIVAIFNLRLSSTAHLVVVGDASNRVFLQNIQVYQQAAHKILNNGVLNDDKVTINATHIAQQLHDQFPELTAVSVALPFIGSHPTIYLLPASPELILKGANGQFLLDNSGRALAAAAPISPKADSQLTIPTVTDQSGLPIHIGQLALPGPSVAFIAEVAGQLTAGHVATTSYILLGGGASELDVHLAGEPYYVKFNLHGSARVEVGDFLAVKQGLDRSHQTPSQYIDVRVDGRAYYL